MAKKWCLAIDITRCDGCGSCILSVRDEYTYNDYPGYSAHIPEVGTNWLWLKEVEQGHGWKIKMDYIPMMFPHDRNLKLDGIPEGSVYVREDGLTIIDPEKAKGHKEIYDKLNALYPGTVFWNEELQLCQIYNFDAHRLDQGDKIPRGCEDCPTQAMHWGDLNDPESDVSKFMAEHGDELEDVFPMEGADYVVKYYKLPKPFICGEVITSDGECAECVKVTLTDKATGEVRETVTDFFGDYQFKYLKKDADYVVSIEAPGCAAKTIDVKLDEAKNLNETEIAVTRADLLK